jgi:hypothetical protein
LNVRFQGYPDDLLSLVLMASTYPLEVVEADRWVKANKNLKGDQLKAAVDKQGWDDSVKSLVAIRSACFALTRRFAEDFARTRSLPGCSWPSSNYPSPSAPMTARAR